VTVSRAAGPGRVPQSGGLRLHAGRAVRYLARLSRPLPDRIDVHVEMPAVPYGGAGARWAGRGDLGDSLAAGRGGGRAPARTVRPDATASPRATGACWRRRSAGWACRRGPTIGCRRCPRTIADPAGEDAIGGEPLAEALKDLGGSGEAPPPRIRFAAAG
jgi:hypothetical protein